MVVRQPQIGARRIAGGRRRGRRLARLAVLPDQQSNEAATLFQQFIEQTGSGDAKRVNDALLR